jgi:predicted short-subunit dehydrogenase-like oxidoreductase (DUF2520 family)
MKRFSIVGAGRLGTALGAALARRGWHPEAIVDRERRAARESRRIIGAGRASTSFTAAALARGVVIIAVPDFAVASVASALARSGGSWTGRTVLHTSGLIPAGILGPLSGRGAVIASLHPVQAFPLKDLPVSVFKGITWGFEGDPAATGTTEAIVRALRGNIILLSAKDKTLYHAACVLASNAFIALEWTAAGVLHKAGVSEGSATGMLLPLLQGTLQNVKSLGPERALTGPVSRGDIATVREHLDALQGDPGTLEVYRVLGRQALCMAAKRGLPPRRVRALKRLLEGR